jgi:phosphoribosyl 1,2-cyclic phosphodiesterase
MSRATADGYQKENKPVIDVTMLVVAMIEFKAYASGSRGNFYTVDDGSTKLMIECGLPFKEIQRILEFKISDITACLLSHEHKDHSRAVKDVIKVGIDVYMSEGTAKEAGASGHRVKTILPKKQFNIGTWTILPFDTQHDAKEPLGFLLANQFGDKLLFATDTYYIKYRFNDLSIIAVECNFSRDILKANVANGLVPVELKNRLLQSHFSLENVKEFLKANDLSKVREIWLLHLSDDNSDADRFKREIQELTGKMVFVAGQ